MIEILDIVGMRRRQKVLLIVFVIELAVAPGIDEVGPVIINMVVWLMIFLVPVIVLSFGVKW